MKSLLNTAAVLTAAIALGGCPDKRPEPVPGPQSAAAAALPSSAATHAPEARRSTPSHGASEISWFQGTLEEAFSHRTCSERGGWFRS
jgi:hypothetical protein